MSQLGIYLNMKKIIKTVLIVFIAILLGINYVYAENEIAQNNSTTNTTTATEEKAKDEKENKTTNSEEKKENENQKNETTETTKTTEMKALI